MKKFIFFKIGGFSRINALLQEHLHSVFPEYRMEVIDVLDDILEKDAIHRLSLFSRACYRYGSRILENRQNPRDFFIRFDDAWEAIHNWSLKNLKPEHVAFTFQTQSLFDASHADIPHFLYTDHTYLANRRYPNRAKPLPISAQWLEAERKLYHHSTVNFTTSEFSATSIREDYGVSEDHVQSVASGINIPMPAENKSPSPKPRRILFAGVDWERKGGPSLIMAFREIRAKVPDAELWIAGCTPAITEEGIKVFGRVSGDAMARLFSEADVFCLPSKYEPSAAVLVEAAAYSLPVVATRVGGSVERVIDGVTGLLVPSEDASALAQALLKILSDATLAASLGREGRKMAETRFNWNVILGKIRDRILSEIR